MDRGFYSRENQERLDTLLDLTVMPKKASAADRERESDPEFVRARRQYPAQPLNHLEHRGLNRVRTRGAEGFARTVCLSIVAANVHRLGRIYLGKDRRRLWVA